MNHSAFIDIQNLKLSLESLGWSLDYAKFRRYLFDKYRVTKAFIFIGYISGNEKFYSFLRKSGFILVFKPTLQFGRYGIKGNVDAELVLHCMIQYPDFDKAIIVSGDGDFYCLIEYLFQREKLLKIGIPDIRKYSALLRGFRDFHFYISDLKNALGYRKRGINGRSKP